MFIHICSALKKFSFQYTYQSPFLGSKIAFELSERGNTSQNRPPLFHWHLTTIILCTHTFVDDLYWIFVPFPSKNIGIYEMNWPQCSPLTWVVDLCLQSLRAAINITACPYLIFVTNFTNISVEKELQSLHAAINITASQPACINRRSQNLYKGSLIDRISQRFDQVGMDV